MNAVERLKLAVNCRFPSATFEEDHLPSGNIWLDIRMNGKFIVVEYKAARRYGVSTLHNRSGWEGYGEGADRWFTRYRDAEKQVLKLLRGRSRRRAIGSKRAPPPHEIGA